MDDDKDDDKLTCLIWGAQEEDIDLEINLSPTTGDCLLIIGEVDFLVFEWTLCCSCSKIGKWDPCESGLKSLGLNDLINLLLSILRSSLDIVLLIVLEIELAWESKGFCFPNSV